MNTTPDEYTTETQTINGVEVTVYGGTKRPVVTYALRGHVTGWLKHHGARTTYANLTCTCHLHGELVNPEGVDTWITYGGEGWADRLNALALAHVQNVTANAFMVRPAGGDRARWADRHRVNLAGLAKMGLDAGDVYELTDGKGGLLRFEDGTRIELARDRSRYAVEGALPIY